MWNFVNDMWKYVNKLSPGLGLLQPLQSHAIITLSNQYDLEYSNLLTKVEHNSQLPHHISPSRVGYGMSI